MTRIYMLWTATFTKDFQYRKMIDLFKSEQQVLRCYHQSNITRWRDEGIDFMSRNVNYLAGSLCITCAWKR